MNRRVPLAFVLAAWLWPQTRAEAWGIKAGVMIAAAAGLGAWCFPRAGRVAARPLAAWSLLSGWCLMAVLWAVDPVRTFGQAIAVAGGAAVVLFAGGRILPVHVAGAWIAVALMESVQVFAPAWFGGEGLRFAGSFVNANHMAALVASGAAVTAATFLRHPAGPRWATLVVVALMSLAAALSGSRAAPLAAVAGLAVIGWRGRGGRVWRHPPFLAAAAAIAGPYAFAGMALSRLAGPGIADEPMAFSRLALWRAALRVEVERPFGVGLGGFGDALGVMLVGAPPQRYASDYAHCEPLQWLCETGVVGLLLLGWSLQVWRRGVARVPRGEYGSPALAAGLASLGVFILVDFPLHMPLLAWLVVLALGALGGAGMPGPRGRVSREVRAVVAGVLIVGGLSSLAVGIADREFALGAKLAAAGRPNQAKVRFERALRVMPIHAGALQGLAAVEPPSPESAARLALARKLRPLWLSPPVRRPPDWKRDVR